MCRSTDEPVESLRLRFALLQSLNNTLENFFLPLVELRQTQTYRNSIAALLCEAKGERGHSRGASSGVDLWERRDPKTFAPL